MTSTLPVPIPRPRPHDHPRPAEADPPTTAVRPATTDDVPAMARLHIDQLPVGLFPSLGARFVARWHQAHIDSDHGVALVCDEPTDDGEQVAGFLVGAVDRGAFRVELLTRHRRALLMYGAGALLVRPRVLARFLRTRSTAYLRRLRRPRIPGTTSGTAVADLTAIAVAPRLHRGGAGRALTAEFLRICAASGATHVEVVADSAASGFYERTGWRCGRTATARDGRSLRWFSVDLRDGGQDR